MAKHPTVFKHLLNVNKIHLEGLNLITNEDGDRELHLQVRPYKRDEHRCPICNRHCPVHDYQSKDRSWRTLDFGTTQTYLHYTPARVKCPEHGVLTSSVPWAINNSRFTRDFDKTIAWMFTHMSRSAITNLMRLDWKTIGRCIERAKTELDPEPWKRFDNLKKIGIDETSYRKGHKYITVVVNHETNAVIWAADGYGREVLEKFFNLLTPEQRASIEHVSADGAKWIHSTVTDYLPNAKRSIDPFHVVQWALEASNTVRLDELKNFKKQLNQYEKASRDKKGVTIHGCLEVTLAKQAKTKIEGIKKLKYAMGKSPENRTPTQQKNFELFVVNNPTLYQAWQLKETLRIILKMKDPKEANAELKTWIQNATQSTLTPFSDLAKKIKRHGKAILNAITYKMNNARIEATNNRIKLVSRKAYGFRNIDNFLAAISLTCSGLPIILPGRLATSPGI